MEEAKLTCLRCGGPLVIDETRCTCPACGAAWPVEGGIPRLAAARYWGEMTQEEARALVRDAQERSWRTAAAERFPVGDNMHISVLDPQRAAWLPLLGLDRSAVALDIGSGLGAITHALACSVGEVYSLEAVPERIEFTQTRLRQEGLDNVHLVQGTALSLPFPSGTFDLVVINGVLEWVGEWDLEGTPRSAQLRFLRAALRLLKPTGVALIGIENRFAYINFLGARDHSGLPYTSLMPRRLATRRLRRSAARHHRTQLNARREYRTYTYSARGYRKLLTEAGFSSASFLWADPGYNLPHSLIPLGAARLMREHLRDMLDLPRAVRPRRLVHLLKRIAFSLPAFAKVAPDFVIFAGREDFAGGALAPWWLETLGSSAGQPGPHRPTPAARPEVASLTAAFSSKQVLRLWQPKWARDRAVVKVGVRSAEHGPTPPEFANLMRVAEHLRHQPPGLVAVPQPLGSMRRGSAIYCLESAAKGTQFLRTAWRPGYYRDVARVRRDFSRVFNASVAMTRALADLRGAEPIDPAWLDPRTLSPQLHQRARLNEPRCPTFPGPWPNGCVQHADFTVGNVFLEPGSDRLEVIDWAGLAAGMPPLYDLFSMILSSGYLDAAGPNADYADASELWLASFVKLFYTTGDPVSGLIAELLTNACQRLGLDPAWIPALLLDFLVVRTHSYRARGSRAAAAIHLHILEYFTDHPERAVLGRFPLCVGAPT